MKNYIEFFYDEDDYLTAQIHKNGKVRTITDPTKLDKLMAICKKRGYTIRGEKVIRRSSAEKITKDYENYIKRIRRLQILGEITDNMRVSFKNPAVGKTITAIILAGTISLTGISLIKAAQAENNQNPEREYHGTYLTKNDEQDDTTTLYMDGDEISIIMEEIEPGQDSKNEINSMFQENAFHFSYENRVGNASYQNAMRYEDLFEKYANMFGIDKEILIAIASQESAGDHYNHLEGGPAIGIMQIEKEPNIGQTIEVYNFELGDKEKITITEEALKDLEQNIKIGAALVRYNIVYNDYSISIGLQNYNMGWGNMAKILDECSKNENTTPQELKNSPTDNSWLEYRSIINAGDPEYIEHIFSYIPNGSTIKIMDTHGNSHELQLSNDYFNTTEKTNF